VIWQALSSPQGAFGFVMAWQANQFDLAAACAGSARFVSKYLRPPAGIASLMVVAIWLGTVRIGWALRSPTFDL